MALYNTPLEPSVQLSVITETGAGTISSPGAFNTIYFLGYPGNQSDLPSYSPELINSINDYENRIGGVPTDTLGLVNYLSLDATFKNLKNAGLIKYIAVRPPTNIHTVSINSTAVVGDTVGYYLTINGVDIKGTIVIPTGTTSVNNYLAEKIALKIQSIVELQTSVYVREVITNAIEFSPFVTGQILNFAFLTSTEGTVSLVTANYTWAIGTPAYTVPIQKDYSQALYTSLKKDDALGIIIAPGFYYTSTFKESERFNKLADSFCRKSDQQHLFITDVSNPDLSKVAVYATVLEYSSGQSVAINSLVKYKGSIYSGNALAATPAATTAIVPIGTRVLLSTAVSIAGITGTVLQSVNATAQFANPLIPTPTELTKFIVISTQQLINEALVNNKLILVEKSSATEQDLYRYRDNFDSVEGHLSVCAPYQNYLGTVLSTDFYIPASSYQAGLWIYVANTFSLATPPASDDYALEATLNSLWEVTETGHALLNGKGINIIKNIGGNQYIMGSRTLAKLDLYNRQNARAILSLYVRSLKAVLNQGLVLKPLTSTGAFLEGLKIRADRLSRAFYLAGLLDGNNDAEAYNNRADNALNPIANLQQGIVKLESKIAQIGMTEKIIVTVQESLLGALNTIL
jgi:hypothetical protein